MSDILNQSPVRNSTRLSAWWVFWGLLASYGRHLVCVHFCDSWSLTSSFSTVLRQRWHLDIDHYAPCLSHIVLKLAYIRQPLPLQIFPQSDPAPPVGLSVGDIRWAACDVRRTRRVSVCVLAKNVLSVSFTTSCADVVSHQRRCQVCAVPWRHHSKIAS